MAKPKLALIPAAQGDKFYSVLPSDGVGDFDFTRNSSATRIAPTGFIEEVGAFGSELVTNGNFDNDSDWTKTNVTIANGVATFVTGTASLQQAISITVGKTYKITYQINGGTGTLNLSSSGFTNVSTVIPSTVGTHIINATAVNTNNLYLVCIGSSNLVIDNISVVEVVGNKSRLNYDLLNGKVVNCPHYLLEPARTNIITYSEDFSQIAWVKSGTSVVSGFISPDGAANAYKLVEGTTNSDHSIYATFTSLPSGIYTISAYVKKGERHKCALADRNSGIYVSFDLNNITVIAQGGMIGNIELLSNGWFKLSATTSNALTIIVPQIFILEDSYTTGLPIFQTYTGDGTSGVYIFGAQLELGSYPTSYIPTNGTAITRAAETATGSGDAATFNDSEGVLMLDINTFSNDGTFRGISLGDATANNVIRIFYSDVSNHINFNVKSSGTNYVTIIYTLNDVTTPTKILAKFKQNDFALWVNGFEVGSANSGILPLNISSLQFFNGTGTGIFYGKTRELQYFDSALTDAQLETLTSWTSLQEMITSQLYTNY